MLSVTLFMPIFFIPCPFQASTTLQNRVVYVSSKICLSLLRNHQNNQTGDSILILIFTVLVHNVSGVSKCPAFMLLNDPSLFEGKGVKCSAYNNICISIKFCID